MISWEMRMFRIKPGTKAPDPEGNETTVNALRFLSSTGLSSTELNGFFYSNYKLCQAGCRQDQKPCEYDSTPSTMTKWQTWRRNATRVVEKSQSSLRVEDAMLLCM